MEMVQENETSKRVRVKGGDKGWIQNRNKTPGTLEKRRKNEFRQAKNELNVEDLVIRWENEGNSQVSKLNKW